MSQSENLTKGANKYIKKLVLILNGLTLSSSSSSSIGGGKSYPHTVAYRYIASETRSIWLGFDLSILKMSHCSECRILRISKLQENFCSDFVLIFTNKSGISKRQCNELQTH